jgi:selenide,water dikinase
MAVASGVDVEVVVADLPALPGAVADRQVGRDPLAVAPGAAADHPGLQGGDGVPDELVWLAADAQTSGGLLLGVDDDAVVDVLAELQRAGLPAAAIGRATRGGSGRITLR